jgi:putative FmdB family regulatory protein
MPIYEYRCVACGREIEVIHGINAEGPSTCDVCGSPMRKLVSTSAIVFRGGGWAKKDARDTRSATSADQTASEGERSASESKKSASGAEKSPAAEGPSGRDKPAETGAKRAGEKDTAGGGQASKPSGSDD